MQDLTQNDKHVLFLLKDIMTRLELAEKKHKEQLTDYFQAIQQRVQAYQLLAQTNSAAKNQTGSSSGLQMAPLPDVNPKFDAFVTEHEYDLLQAWHKGEDVLVAKLSI